VFIRACALFLVPPLVLGPPGSPLDCAESDSADCSPSATEAAEVECVPACREGFVCHAGDCISACNPACPADQQCTAEAECIDASPEASPLTVVDNSCDASCPHPYVCQQGECRITEAYVEGLEREGNGRIKGGVWTMAIGGAVIGLGLIVGGVALAQNKRWDRRHIELADQPDCASSAACAQERDAAWMTRDKWATVQWAFMTGVAPTGLLLLVAGGIAYGVGKSKLARSQEFRGKPVVWMTPDGAGAGLTLEF
jgi:hypothetical protein